MSIRRESIKNATHDEWMEIRSKTIGGSEAGAVVGLSPYMSPFALWCEKTGRAKPFEGNLATEVGSYLEEFVAKKFTDETGLEVKKTNYIWFNDEFPNQHASPDRLLKATTKYGLNGLKCGLEIKTTSAFGKFKNDSFPEQYYTQCVQYLAITEYDIWFLAVLVGNREFHIYALRRDEYVPVPEFVESEMVVGDDEIFALRDACDEFAEMVKNDTPPLADGAESTTEALSDAYPEAQDGSKTWLEGYEDTVNELVRLTAEGKDIERETERLKNILKAQMGEYETAGCGAYTVCWTNSFSAGLDTKKLKAEHPEIYAQYYRKKPTRKFSVK